MKLLEIAFWMLGAALATGYFTLRAEGESDRQLGIAQFRGQQVETPTADAQHLVKPVFERLLDGGADPIVAVSAEVTVLAVLRIQRVDLEVPVKYGTSEEVLAGAAGLIEGTARPGSSGNIGIAAHRDTFFRALEDVVLGDLIEIDTGAGVRIYEVVTLSVVDPEDVEVLEYSGIDQVTLVTCFPFHYFGNAPQRFIVRADDATLI